MPPPTVPPAADVPPPPPPVPTGAPLGIGIPRAPPALGSRMNRSSRLKTPDDAGMSVSPVTDLQRGRGVALLVGCCVLGVEAFLGAGDERVVLPAVEIGEAER